MRVYFGKPRTTLGWKDLINDPNLDDSFEIENGPAIGRTLLRDTLTLGLPTATEALDPITPQYLHDLISWPAIRAKTTESQTHREMASGLSSPVGFKNDTDAGLAVAVNALQSVANPHLILGINSEGKVSVFETSGNRYGHIVLRGGNHGPYHLAEQITQHETDLQAADLPANIMVDCSHANSEKDPALQPAVTHHVSEQIVDSNHSIIGLMLKSHLEAGNQEIPDDLSALRCGVSVTDGCINWATTCRSSSNSLNLAPPHWKHERLSNTPDCDHCDRCYPARLPIAGFALAKSFQPHLLRSYPQRCNPGTRRQIAVPRIGPL